ncbi:NmrA family transcriptional regulator [Streptomyces sp. NRRL B-1568]|nr:NmrA family transcriptional regulator [Streptomyces sp. NRRL B-1568]
MTILVTGSRGRVGRALIDLLRDGGHDVRAASREPGELELPGGTPTARLALDDPATFPAALDGVSSVFLYSDPTHIDTFIDEAVKAGVGHIVLLSSAATLIPDAESNPIGRPHFLTERALAAGPITSTFLQPGAFATNALGWAWSIKSTGAVNLPYPDSHSDAIHELDLAESALAALTNPEFAGNAYALSGPESLTFRDQLDHLSHATGKPIGLNVVSEEEWKREVSAFLPDHVSDTLLALWREMDGKPQPVTGAASVEQLTGHPARTFATWAKDHAGDFAA